MQNVPASVILCMIKTFRKKVEVEILLITLLLVNQLCCAYIKLRPHQLKLCNSRSLGCKYSNEAGKTPSWVTRTIEVRLLAALQTDLQLGAKA